MSSEHLEQYIRDELYIRDEKYISDYKYISYEYWPVITSFLKEEKYCLINHERAVVGSISEKNSTV